MTTLIHNAPRERDRNHERALRMAQVTEQFATRLTLRPVRCQVAPNGVAPAWSTSNTISFNGAQLGDLLDPRVVTATKGLALHEVCHILFTPRTGTDLVQWVLSNKLGNAFNALEDQRIETLMVGRFGQTVVDWFTFMVGEHLLDSPQALDASYPLLAGRKYLPVEVRALSRKSYINQQDVEELAQITSDYRTLLFPQDTEVAKALISRFDQLVKTIPDPDGNGGGNGEGQGGEGKGGWKRVPDPNGHQHRPEGEHESGKSRPLTKKEQEQARSKAEARDEENDDEFDFGDGSGHESDADETEGEQSNGDGANDSDSDSDSDADGDGDGEGEGADSDSDSDSDSSGAGSGSASKQFTDALEQALNDSFERLADQVADDIAKFNGDVQLEGERVAEPARSNYSKRTASPLAVRGSRSFGIELERLRAQHDPAWERRVESGRINAQRYMTTDDFDEVFDRFEQGRTDAVDIEAVILLDTSGSMGGAPIQLASESMWAIKRALDAVNASCTVVGFSWDSSASLLFSSNERAESYVRHSPTGGGTNPTQALRYAKDVFAHSSRAIKVLFTITDGMWDATTKPHEVVRQLRDGGVLTALATLNMPVGASTHEHEISVSLTNAGDLFNIARQLVRIGIQRNLVTA
jgi:Mg-chelatase subunit ChlD